ncbi:MAG TPA: glycerophosphodiester phosphodiesterase [Dehalococcoidia bacterium]|nr:glycerophosphodiester phosphodiesterase [Dehalococcoidia bacterium]
MGELAGHDGERNRPAARGVPFIGIAHGAGNDRVLLNRAVEGGVDYVEADLWPRGSNDVVARHERRFPFLPLLYDKWYIKPDVRPVYLEEIVAAAAAKGVRVYADIKSGRYGFVDRVISILRRGGAYEGAILSGHHWFDLARAKRELGIAAFPSIPDGTALDRFWSFIGRRAEMFDGVAIRHWLITPRTVSRFRDLGLRVLPWTVDSHSRAHELMALGADGVISNSVDLIHEMSLAQVSALPRAG